MLLHKIQYTFMLIYNLIKLFYFFFRTTSITAPFLSVFVFGKKKILLQNDCGFSTISGERGLSRNKRINIETRGNVCDAQTTTTPGPRRIKTSVVSAGCRTFGRPHDSTRRTVRSRRRGRRSSSSSSSCGRSDSTRRPARPPSASD